MIDVLFDRFAKVMFVGPSNVKLLMNSNETYHDGSTKN